LNREDRFSTISNKLTPMAEVCNSCISIEGAALDGMAAITQDTANELEKARAKHHGND
jgi:hypothetical protein